MHRTSPAQAGRTTGEGSARGLIHGVWLALLLALLPAPSADAQTNIAAVPTAEVPPHVHVAPQLRDTVAQLRQRSPTFRAQMEAIGRAERLGIAIVLQAWSGVGPPAWTEIRRFESGLILAVIRIHSIADKEELLAHEIEHVLEQVEGVRLQELSRTGREAWRTGGSYESERAIRVGRRVAVEAKGRDRLASR